MTDKEKEALKLISKLPEEDQFYLLGGMKVEETKEDISLEFSSFHGGDDRSLDDTLTALKLGEQLSGMSLAATATLMQQRVSDVYQYQRIPAMKAAATSVGGLQASAMKALQAQQALEQKYAMIGTLGGAALSLLTRAPAVARDVRAIVETSRAIRSAESLAEAAKIFGAFVRTGKAVKTAADVASVVGTVATAESIIGPLLIQAGRLAVEQAIMFAMMKGGEALARQLAKRYTWRMAASSFAADLLDKNKAIQEFQGYAPFLANYNDLGFNYGITGVDTIKQFLDTVSVSGQTPAQMGYDVNNMTSIISQLAMSVNNLSGESAKEYAAEIASRSAVFGTNADMMGSIFTNIAMSGTRRQEISRATELFGSFFSAVAGGERSSTSQLALVNTLTEFSKQHGAERYIGGDGGGRALAGITDFLMSGPFKDKQSVEPVVKTVNSLDALLTSGADVTANPRARDLLASSGIGFLEATKGVLGNDETFNKLLGGLQRQTGIGVESFTAEGTLKDEKAIPLFNYLKYNLGISDTNTFQIIVGGLNAYVHGNRAVAPSGKDFTTAGAGFEDSGVFKMLSVIAKGNVDLSNIIVKNMDVYAELDSVIRNLYLGVTPYVIKAVGQFSIAVGGVLHDYMHDIPLDDNIQLTPPRYDSIPMTTGAANMSKDEFFTMVARSAVAAEKETGINVNIPLLLAQAAHETGFGTSRLAREDFNLFGIKSTDGSGRDFRKYSSFEESIKDYIGMMGRNWFYQDALQYSDPSQFEQALQAILPVLDSKGNVVESGYVAIHEISGYIAGTNRLVSEYGLLNYQRFLNNKPTEIHMNIDLNNDTMIEPGSFIEGLVRRLRSSLGGH